MARHYLLSDEARRRLSEGAAREGVNESALLERLIIENVHRKGRWHTSRMEIEVAGRTVTGDLGSHGVERFPYTKFLPPSLDERVVADGIVVRLDAAGRAGARSEPPVAVK